jgi:hypothetical protein
MTSSPWQGNWAERIHRYVQARGFESVTDFAAHHPFLSTLDLAGLLGPDVAAVQLENILYTEAMRCGAVHRLVRDWLVRRLHECMPNGWGVGTEDEFTYARGISYGRWISSLDDHHQGAGEQAWDQLKALDIPTGWLPSGPDDPIIERAFAGVRFDAPAGEDLS